MPKCAIQAHDGDINGIAIGTKDNLTFAASCGRDRTIQIFRKINAHLELFQTLNDHTANITDALFLEITCDLISISSDRTILIRRFACVDEGSQAFISIRTIVLKASPVSMTRVPEEPGLLVVSTMDRQIQKYDISSGRLLHGFKIADPESSENMIMNSIEVHIQDNGANRNRLLIGISSPDKSIRIHDYDSGSLLTKEYGQTGISAARLISGNGRYDERQRRLVSCSLDCTIMMWDLTSAARPGLGTSLTATSKAACSPITQTQILTHPRRQILSKAQFSSLQKSLRIDDNTSAPIQTTYPISLRRKTSRLSMTLDSKTSLTHRTGPVKDSPMSSKVMNDCRSSQSYSARNASPHSSRNSQNKAPSSDLQRDRTKSAANLNDLDGSAKQLCDSLHMFRKRATSAAIDKLDAVVMQELEFELKLTTNMISETAYKIQLGGDTAAGDPLDVYLTELIDERLALRAKSDKKRLPNK